MTVPEVLSLIGCVQILWIHPIKENPPDLLWACVVTKFLNKQYITVDNSYKLLYTVCRWRERI